VLHGLPQSAPNASQMPHIVNTGDERESKGNWAAKCFTENLRDNWIYDLADEKWWPFEYVAFAFDVDDYGGDRGNYTLHGVLPKDTIVWDGFLDVLESFVGPTQVGIRLETAVGATNDIYPMTAASGVTAGMKDITPDGTAANAIKVTSEDKPVKVRVAGGAGAGLSAGAFVLYLRCFRGFTIADRERFAILGMGGAQGDEAEGGVGGAAAVEYSSSSSQSSVAVSSSSSNSSSSSSSSASSASSGGSSESSSSAGFSSSSSSSSGAFSSSSSGAYSSSSSSSSGGSSPSSSSGGSSPSSESSSSSSASSSSSSSSSSASSSSSSSGSSSSS
jgi:hypothetical protein